MKRGPVAEIAGAQRDVIVRYPVELVVRAPSVTPCHTGRPVPSRPPLLALKCRENVESLMRLYSMVAADSMGSGREKYALARECEASVHYRYSPWTGLVCACSPATGANLNE